MNLVEKLFDAFVGHFCDTLLIKWEVLQEKINLAIDEKGLT